MMVPVIDIARHQGVVDFDKVVEAGIEGVIVRLGNGDVLDDRAHVYVPDAHSVGLVVGGYWFCNPKKDATGAVQMERLVDRAAQLNANDIPPMMDVENFTKEGGRLPHLRGASWLRWLEQGKQRIIDLDGRTPILYGNKAYWDGDDGPQAPGTFPECDVMCARYPFYSVLACFLNPPPSDALEWESWIMRKTSKRPQMPSGFGEWVGWQFSAGYNRQGHRFGASSTDLDLNIVRRDVWDRWVGVTAPPVVVPAPEIELPPVVITPVEVDLALYGGTSMFVIVANSDDRSNPRRWAWNGAILVNLSFDDHVRFVRCGFYESGHDDLEKPEWMTSDELARYRSV